jgi:hypothetical protein
MPLVGGPSDKAGNSYERRWTVFAMLDVLDGRAQSLRIEVPGDDGAGSEFRLMVGAVPEWHQAKRQRAAGPWTMSALVSEGVVQPWRAHLARGERCVFVSTTGADELRELADRARSAQSWDEFDSEFLAAEDVRKRFDRLRRAWIDPPQRDVHNALQYVQVRSIGEDDLAEFIVERLRSRTTGAEPATVAAVLAQLADDSVHQELSAADVWAHLASHGITPRNFSQDAAVARLVTDSAESYLARLQPLYIGGHDIPRPEAATAFDHLDSGHRVVLAGAAGAGKSVVSSQTVTLARDQGWPVLVLSADRLPVVTTAQLGAHLGLPDSPVVVLAGLAAGSDALLVIDQLDAVSVVSGRHPERLALITDLLQEARSHPGLRVLLACRQFDIDNDRALRAVAHDDTATVVLVGDLTDDQVRTALTDAGLASDVRKPLLRLLAVPLHLALYVELAQAGVGTVRSARTLTDLYDSYWTAKRTACRTARGGADDWPAVVNRLVLRMSDRQELTVPEAVLDDLDQQAKVMASEGVLSVSQGRVAFFHETFFDYCFARQFVAAGGTVRTLLTGTEQDLFRRAQVRQLLTFQRSADPAGYLTDFTWLVTSPDVRLHIKALVISLLDTTPDPTRDEWEALRPIADNPQAPLHNRLWQAVRRNSVWFPVLDGAGVWAAMLRDGGEAADRALWAMSGSAADHSTRVVALLAEAPNEFWRARRTGFLRMAEVHRARPLVDLLLAAVHDGDVDSSDTDLSFILRQLAKTQPAWAAEVLAAAVRHAAADDATNPFQPGARMPRRAQDLTAEVQAIAAGAPGEYVELLLPLLLDLMRAHERPDWPGSELVLDALWSHHIYRAHGSLRVDLYDGMGVALAALAEADPARAASAFAQLRAEPYESAAFLLARGYAGDPAAIADEAAAWLVATPGARRLGYSDSPAWVTRQLVAAITPHCSDEQFDQLVNALMYYASPYERTYDGLRARGSTELCLLNGIDPARRPIHVERRLAELRRKFGRDDAHPPEGVTGGTVPPPIPEDRARRMTDQQWLNAMRRHGTSETRWRAGRLIGDAWSQGQVLETVTAEDPQRFARLLLEIPRGTAEAYVASILRGLAAARLDSDLLLAVCRHARDIGGSDANRWLVSLVQSHAAGTVPDELVRLVADIAAGDPDPAGRDPGETWNGGSIDSAALNSTRGAAALALGDLIAEDPHRLPPVLPALQQLVADPQPEARAATIAALAPLLYTDPDGALALFHQAVGDVTDELLGSRYVEHFLDHAIRRGRYADVAATLQRMLAAAEDDTRQVGARRLTIASYHAPALDGNVDAILGGADDIARAAAVEVFADNVTYPPRRDRSIAVIAAALHDPVKTVRDAAERAFYRLDDERLSDYIPMIAALAGSPALADGAGAALHSLETSRHPLPPEVLEVCEAFVTAHQRDIGDIATAAAGDAMYVVRLALRMHAQHTDPELRRRCLDLIDQLVAFRAHDIERDLDTIER